MGEGLSDLQEKVGICGFANRIYRMVRNQTSRPLSCHQKRPLRPQKRQLLGKQRPLTIQNNLPLQPRQVQFQHDAILRNPNFHRSPKQQNNLRR